MFPEKGAHGQISLSNTEQYIIASKKPYSQKSCLMKTFPNLFGLRAFFTNIC